MNKLRFAIIGAGNGGQSFAAHLSLLGYQVCLYDTDEQKIEKLRKAGKIQVSGAIKGEAYPACITSDIAEAVRGADILMIVVPTCFHVDVALSVAPYLVDGQVIILNPGATGGVLEFRHILNQRGCRAKVTLAEAATLLYACHSTEPGSVTISGIKKHVEIAALPGEEGEWVAGLLNTIYPQFAPVSNILITSLNNVNAMCHPLPTLLNTARIECQVSFEYYFEGLTPSIAKIMERLDAERLAIGEALGVKLTSLKDWFTISYGVNGETLFETIQKNKAYIGIKGPKSLYHRFLFEDIPTGLVPLACLGSVLGIDMPVTKTFVELGNMVLERDYWKEGRTVEKLGLTGLSPEKIRLLVS